jgi:hypothetical protein
MDAQHMTGLTMQWQGQKRIPAMFNLSMFLLLVGVLLFMNSSPLLGFTIALVALTLGMIPNE